MGLVCNQNTQFPVCSQGDCVCSKTKGLFIVGDGTTQGSCDLRSHKCQANGRCAECTTDAQCTGLTDTCISTKCSCGTDGPCNSTISNECLGGNCMCGANPKCSQKQEMLVLNLASGCTRQLCEGVLLPNFTYIAPICGCFWDTTIVNGAEIGCKVPRSDQEVCQPISKYYNPLFIKNRLSYAGREVLECDDIFGDQEGEYHCLGIVIPHTHTHTQNLV